MRPFPTLTWMPMWFHQPKLEKKLTQSAKAKFDKKDIRTTNNTHFPLTSNQTSSLFRVCLLALVLEPETFSFANWVWGVLPRKPTCPVKRSHFKRKVVFQAPLFRRQPIHQSSSTTSPKIQTCRVFKNVQEKQTTPTPNLLSLRQERLCVILGNRGLHHLAATARQR